MTRPDFIYAYSREGAVLTKGENTYTFKPGEFEAIMRDARRYQFLRGGESRKEQYGPGKYTRTARLGVRKENEVVKHAPNMKLDVEVEGWGYELHEMFNDGELHTGQGGFWSVQSIDGEVMDATIDRFMAEAKKIASRKRRARARAKLRKVKA